MYYAQVADLIVCNEMSAEHVSHLNAPFSTCQAGREVSKDQVSRALKRAGGAAAVLNAEDSDSVVRGVASQRRDRFGKRLPQSKPLDQP